MRETRLSERKEVLCVNSTFLPKFFFLFTIITAYCKHSHNLENVWLALLEDGRLSTTFVWLFSGEDDDDSL